MPPPAQKTMNDYTVRSDIQDTDQIAGKRGSSAGAESIWTWALLKAAAIAGGVRQQNPLGSVTVLVKGKDNTDTLAANRTYTISGTPADGDITNLNLVVTSTATVSFPPSRRLGGATAGLITGLLVPLGNHEFSFKRIGGVYWLADSVGETTETPA